jgi:hypothetical protein
MKAIRSYLVRGFALVAMFAVLCALLGRAHAGLPVSLPPLGTDVDDDLCDKEKDSREKLLCLAYLWMRQRLTSEEVTRAHAQEIGDGRSCRTLIQSEIEEASTWSAPMFERAPDDDVSAGIPDRIVEMTRAVHAVCEGPGISLPPDEARSLAEDTRKHLVTLDKIASAVGRLIVEETRCRAEQKCRTGRATTASADGGKAAEATFRRVVSRLCAEDLESALTHHRDDAEKLKVERRLEGLKALYATYRRRPWGGWASEPACVLDGSANRR